LEAFQFHGFNGKRRVVSFGWKYGFPAQRLEAIEPIPQFLLPLRNQAARFGGLGDDELEQVLVTEHQARATSGWHKDKAVFDEMIDISFGASCTMRFRLSSRVDCGKGATSYSNPAPPTSSPGVAVRLGGLPPAG
jgi:alkylated DNA repair dioxygenase AlkB